MPIKPPCFVESVTLHMGFCIFCAEYICIFMLSAVNNTAVGTSKELFRAARFPIDASCCSAAAAANRRPAMPCPPVRGSSSFEQQLVDTAAECGISFQRQKRSRVLRTRERLYSLAVFALLDSFSRHGLNLQIFSEFTPCDTNIKLVALTRRHFPSQAYAVYRPPRRQCGRYCWKAHGIRMSVGAPCEDS